LIAALAATRGEGAAFAVAAYSAKTRPISTTTGPVGGAAARRLASSAIVVAMTRSSVRVARSTATAGVVASSPASPASATS